ncbi:hypothetical protein ATORI0001_1426 [Lancefieldella rimae ATCC 49626]|uniref:Uncharacterized protein n=1 Tax=Lancefieldella rimae (strain ATCC 49626 / DSM 7090 / CCUG 31168 / NBRC 15546 / VPI D140H-11A) TaxID=553184 RepID=B9CM87_LANR4|nr:hypothetical protein ATORI0001_1426 [Lancefieldella rimae ATCC 49626]
MQSEKYEIPLFNARFRVQNSDLEKQLVIIVIRILQTIF